MSRGGASVAAVALAAALVLGAVGCRDGDVVSMDALSQTVLQQDDVPEFQLFHGARQGRADLPSGERAEPDRFGRKGGWVAR